MMSARNKIVPLKCNEAIVSEYEEKRKARLGDTPEALEYQKKVASLIDVERDKSKYARDEAMMKYGGSIVSQAIDLMLFTESIITSRFQLINVEGTDLPGYHLKIVPEIDVWRMSGHGFPNASVKLSSVSQTIPQPYQISTDRIYQYMPSVLTGNTGSDVDIKTRAAYEIDQRVEDDLWTLLTATLGTFSNAWVYDTRIQDLPTSNSLDLSAEGGITVGWMRSLLAAVDQIPERNGTGIVTGESAKIDTIIIPSSSAQDIRQWVSVVSTVAGGTQSQDGADAISPALHAELERTGVVAINTMWGEPVFIRKSKRLMGTSTADWEKYAWVFLNGPVGRLMIWNAETGVITHDDRLTNRQEGMSIHKTIAIDSPSPWAPNFMRVKIKT